MNTFKVRLFVIAIIILISTLPIHSQNNHPPTRVEMVETIHDAFRDVVKNAIGPNKSSEPCVAHLKDIIANDKETLHALRTNLLISVKDVQRSLSFDSEVSGVELGPFKDYTDKAIFAFHNTSSFDAFAEYFTGKPINNIDDSTKNELTDYYTNYLTNNEVDWFVESRQNYTSDYLCNRSYHFEANIKEWNYPKAQWNIKISSEISCDCVSDNDRFVDDAKYEYRATAEGSFTGKVMTMEKPKNPTLKILSLNCCSQKKEEDTSKAEPKTALKFAFGGKDTDGDGIYDKDDECPEVPGHPEFNGCPDTDGDGITDAKDDCPDTAGVAEFNGCPDTDGDGIADPKDDCPTRAGLIELNGCPDKDGDGISDLKDHCPDTPGPAKFNGCPTETLDNKVNNDSKSENPRAVQMEFEDDKPDSIFDSSWGDEALSLTMGLGAPLGDEADFFGFSYSADLGYFHKVSDKFQIGATAGYTRYTGKETDFGFETEGESFIPINAKVNYRLSNAFGIEAGLGYAISASEGGEGGLMYSAGPFWRLSETVLIVLNYVNIAFGEGSLPAIMLSGRFSLSKK